MDLSVVSLPSGLLRPCMCLELGRRGPVVTKEFITPEKAATRQKISPGKCHERNLAGVPPGHHIRR